LKKEEGRSPSLSEERFTCLIRAQKNELNTGGAPELSLKDPEGKRASKGYERGFHHPPRFEKKEKKKEGRHLRGSPLMNKSSRGGKSLNMERGFQP